jgi:hypothetical protein
MASGFTTILAACLIICGMAVALFGGFMIMVNFSPLNLLPLAVGVIGMIVGFVFMAAASYILKQN